MVKVGDIVYIHGRYVELPPGESSLPLECANHYVEVLEANTCFIQVRCPYTDTLTKLFHNEYDVLKDKRKRRELPTWF